MTPPHSDHFNGKTFFQPGQPHTGGLLRDFWRWKFTAKSGPWPGRVLTPPPASLPIVADGQCVATWIGHASFLLSSGRLNILVDPVFSDRASPVGWAGPRRVHPPGIALRDLPRVDAVLLSHDHYDHCDTAALRLLAAGAAREAVFVAPLRHRDLLVAAGAGRIVELDWWDQHILAEGAVVTLTPSRHWSNRLGTPRNYRLWGGFFINLDARRVWFVGDSGYDATIFQAIRARCGPPDFAMVPIGAYEPRWFMAPMHMNPAEAVQTHCDVGANVSVAMHWGTFQLTDEGHQEPVAALAAARAAAGLRAQDFRVVQPGGSVVL